MYKILHLPSATYVEYYPYNNVNKLADIKFSSKKEAEYAIEHRTVKKSVYGDYYLMLEGKVISEVAILNLKTNNQYVPIEHLSVVEI